MAVGLVRLLEFGQIIEHVDLIVVRKGEKVTVDISVHVEGDSFPGTIVVVDHNTLTVEAEATHIPTSLTVSVEGLTDGTQIHAGDVELPKGTTLVTDASALVLAITTPAGSSADAAAVEALAAASSAASTAAAEAAAAE